MALPKINVPYFTTKLPYAKENVRFRPFLVGDQKNVLIAAESDDESSVLQSIVDLVDNCTDHSQSYADLPVVNLEWMFLNIRAKSIGEMVEMTYQCNNRIDDVKCGHHNTIEVDIRTAKIPPQPDTLIHIADDIYVQLSQVTPRNIIDGDGDEELLYKNTRMIIQGDSTYTEFDRSELEDFYASLPVDAGERISEFFKTPQLLTLTISSVCEKCGAVGKIELSGVMNFFG